METTTMLYIVYGLLTLMVLAGIWMMSRVELAKQGNRLSAVAMALAVCISLWQAGVTSSILGLLIFICLGAVLGLRLAHRVQMIQMPQLVALLNGLGGAASALVGALFLLYPESGNPMYLSFNIGSAFLAVVIGLITLVGSLVAAGKLHRVLAQKPVVYPAHQLLSSVCMGLCIGVVISGYTGASDDEINLIAVCSAIVAPIAFGWLFAIRVGGADMPITISLLNSLSGLAGAIAGLATGDIFLVAVGGIVGASGLLLTQIMCRAMNRSLTAILFAQEAPKHKTAAVNTTQETKEAEAPESATLIEQNDLGATLRKAREVIIVPGYGMALSQAQADVYALAEALKGQGARVRYAIHPVAGRMPGHMNVLLSEAGVDYEEQIAMDDINDDFKHSDLVVVIGANDVLNPAARHAEGTPIYGMPVLNVDEARHVVICNFDLNAGYAGVPNPLYTRSEGVHLLLGDAKESVRTLAKKLIEEDAPAAGTKEVSDAPSPKAILHAAREVIIVPGYGMALSQAQADVYALAEALKGQGARVRYAIHPVAGRMPGHMNVLLSEAGVDYEEQIAMDDINDDFKHSDLVVVIGANDVLNPAARHAEGTPIYGMPVLNVDEARHVVICNFDLNAGYAGVPNPLYTRSEGVHLLLGDAKESVRSLTQMLSEPLEQVIGASHEPTGAISAENSTELLADLLPTVKDVIIVPGYGMALSQAQHEVRSLAQKMIAQGARVRYAIHPVAGRMPGHMNVLLCEADVAYEDLYEMDSINDDFKYSDLVVVIGANDVLNPAARHAEDTPIYGMPVLNVDEARHVVICNFDLNPGYAGVPNPLYTRSEGVHLLLGDAKESVRSLIALLS